MKLTRETWRKVEPLLAAGLDLPATDRAAWLARLEATDPETAPLVRRMLATHERAENARELETVPRLAPLPAWSSTHAAGQRIGPFELLRPLGRGGMGEVWLARQADGRVQRDVALKLPVLGPQGDPSRERFRRERDILARLEHPHIARLYDAGVTDAGQPWLAMEYVAGCTLSEYVQSHGLRVPERLALFRQVLAAVAHAHRRLVVHRDLKPANILIDAAGQARLLDFGIAKLVEGGEREAGAADLTRLGGRVMTLRYAAPEQVEAGAITTATDVYALGVILHELLTGLSPYRAVREGRALTERMLLEEEPALPSRLAIDRRLARALAGDLDAIVLKSLRRDPAERYASVERFDEDLAAHLEKRPVRARAGTWRYLASRFVMRRKLPIAAAAAVLATLVAGLVVADRERRIAVAEKARAERHFASVRKLANAFILDVNREIENVPGTLKARQMLVKTSLEYLDALAQEAGDDALLLAELAAGYRDIANIQGQFGGANTGDVPAALANYEKSRRLFVAAGAARPDDPKILRPHFNLAYMLARAYAVTGDARWQAEIAGTVALAQRLAALPGALPADRARVAIALAEQANLGNFVFGQTPEVEAQVMKAVGLMEAAVREGPDDPTLPATLASAYQRASLIFFGVRRTPESTRRAIDYARKSLATAREVLARDPAAANMRNFELSALTQLSEAHTFLGEDREADRVIGEALALGKAAYERDPGNANIALQTIKLLGQATHTADRLGDLPRAIGHGREGLAIAARVAQGARESLDMRNAIAEARFSLGEALLHRAEATSLARAERLALLREARPMLGATRDFLAEIRARNVTQADEASEKEVAEAIRRCDELAARLSKG